MADVRHTLLEATRALERAGTPAPRLDAEWLLAHVLGIDPCGSVSYTHARAHEPVPELV